MSFQLMTSDFQAAIDFSSAEEQRQLDKHLEDGDLFDWATLLQSITKRMVKHDESEVKGIFKNMGLGESPFKNLN